MKYTVLGKTGLRVSSLALGTMTFGTEWGIGADEADSRRIFSIYTDRGGNFIDTANMYTGGSSERMVGAFIKGQRERLVLASKYSLSMDATNLNSGGGNRKAMMQSLEASLRRLGTDYLDLYWVHAHDGLTPVDETIRALDDLVRAGKILYVGYSDHPAWLVSRADALAERAGWTRPAAIQVEYSLALRDAERDLLPMADNLDMGVLAWAPLAGGALSGKYLDGRGEGRVGGDNVGGYLKYRSDRTAAISRAVVAAARDIDVSPSRLAVAWLMQRSPRIIPLLGARTPDQLIDTVEAADLVIPAEILAGLDAASAIDVGSPHDVLQTDWSGWYGAEKAELDPRITPTGVIRPG